MGHRATYAIRENGEVRVFYSHWGALTVPQDILWGPKVAETFILSNHEGGEWLDTTWAEGGVALDKDTRTVAFFGGDELEEDDLKPLVLGLMEYFWGPEKWTVRWVDDLRGIAEQVGIAPDLVESSASEVAPIEPSRLGSNLERGICCGLVAIFGEAGWKDVAIDYSLPGTLANGPSVIDTLKKLPDLDGMRRIEKSLDDADAEDDRSPLRSRLEEFAVIHTGFNTLSLCVPDFEADELRFLHGRWPGWTIRRHDGGIAEHFKLTVREVPDDLVPRPEDDQETPRSFHEKLEIVKEAILGAEARKQATAATVSEVVRTVTSTEGDAMKVAAAALDRAPASPIDAETAERLLRRAVNSINR